MTHANSPVACSTQLLRKKPPLTQKESPKNQKKESPKNQKIPRDHPFNDPCHTRALASLAPRSQRYLTYNHVDPCKSFLRTLCNNVNFPTPLGFNIRLLEPILPPSLIGSNHIFDRTLRLN